MANISSPEGATVLIAEKLTRPPTAGTLEADIFEASRRALASTDNPLAVLARRDAPSREMFRNINTENIGRRGAGRRRIVTGEERVRLDRANILADTYSDIIRGENIPALVANPQIRTVVESLISENPTYLAAYNALPVADRSALITRYLSEPNTRSQVVSKLKEKVTVESIIGDDIEQKRQTRDRLSTESDSIQTEITTLETELSGLRDEIRQFQSNIDPATNNIVEGTYVSQLATHASRINDSNARISNLTSAIEIGQQELAVISREKSIMLRSRTFDQNVVDAYDADTLRLENEIRANRDRLSTAQKTLAVDTEKKNAIDSRKETLGTRKTEIENRLKDLRKKLDGDGEVEGLLAELTAAETGLTTAIADKRNKEIRYVSDLESILSEAIEDTMIKDFNRIATAETTARTTAEARVKTETERQIEEALKNRYQNGDEVDWVNFRTDYLSFMANGEDAVLAGFMPAGTTIDQFRIDNKDAYDKLVTDIKSKLGKLRFSQPRQGGRLRQTLLGPEPISRGEALALVNRLGSETEFTKLLESNTAFRKALAQAETDKVLNLEGKVTERIKKLPLGKILLALAAFLGIGIFKGAGS